MARLDPNDPEWRAMVRAIGHDRADDTRRLGFADWLDERYRTPFSRFIRDMVALARTDPENELSPFYWLEEKRPGLDPGWEVYDRCRQDLLATWAKWPPLADLMPSPYSRQWWFHRGWPSMVTMPWDLWMDQGDQLLAVGPVGVVRLFNPPDCEAEYHRSCTLLTPRDTRLLARLPRGGATWVVKHEPGNHPWGDQRRLADDYATVQALRKAWPRECVTDFVLERGMP